MFTGDLSDFSLREILQFLTSTSRSGVLQVRGGAVTAGIALTDGGVCFALLDVERVGGLGVRLAVGGVLDVENVRRITGQNRGDAIAAAIALAVEAADADAQADVHDLYLEQTYETLVWLTRLDQASFSFVLYEQLTDWPFAVATVDDVHVEVDVRAELWSQLSEAVGDMTAVCGLLPDAAAVTDVVLTADEWRVVTLIDGRRAIGDLVELSGIGHLETCAQLDQLVEQGLVELVARGDRTTLTAMLDDLGVESTLTPAAPATDVPIATVGSPFPEPIADAVTVADNAPDGLGLDEQHATDLDAVSDTPAPVPAIADDEDVNHALLTRLLHRSTAAQ